ncbi:Thialysine N-epsilon-acetyltransferase [Frankliniella fusca]|uniref:Thialysine N-epsilon-acetyltransferase n=1 Tax=Frankliniella fusca TaxID=407009 RepID=A0AAE1H4S8_9NEOP|nr:Thialysine N-epsilon-acetyltransferase [Frankliniella fusca]
MSLPVVRDARREDCREVQRLIQELADFERMPNGPKIDAKVLERDGFDLSPPLYHCFVVDDPSDPTKLIGYAIYFLGFGTMVGRRMYLEDIYITEKYRKKHLGNALFQKVAQKGLEMNCADMEFIVLNWNPAQEFYKARGARDVTKEEGWHLFRIGGESLQKIAESKTKSSLIVRDARKDDCSEVLRLIQELADFEKTGFTQLSAQDIEQDFFSCDRPLFHCVVVEDPDDTSKLIGYSIYYNHYGTWTGRRMYLRDIFVNVAYRGKHIGDALLREVAQKAVETGCVDMDFIVVDWNPAQAFYKARGATDITLSEAWHLCRVNKDDLRKVAEGKNY